MSKPISHAEADYFSNYRESKSPTFGTKKRGRGTWPHWTKLYTRRAHRRGLKERLRKGLE